MNLYMYFYANIQDTRGNTLIILYIIACLTLLSCRTQIYLFFKNTVDQDQLASDKAIWPGSTLFSTPIEKNMLTTGMLQVNRIKIGDKCEVH